MKLKHKIQHYLTITDRELNYLIVLCSILFFAMMVKFVKQTRVPDFSAQYAALDSLSALANESIQTVRADTSLTNTSESKDNSSAKNQTVNINTGTPDELVSLPGIGPAMAGRIIDYRESYGSFRTVDELVNVRGIGAKTLAKLKPHITV